VQFFFYKRWPIIVFYGRWCLFVRCCRKNLQCRSARFFLSSSTVVVVQPTPACFHLLGKESISPPPKKYDSPILIKKHASRRRPGKMTDRFLKKKHHWMTPIEHFLIDIIQIFFRDWIENTIAADIGRCEAATDIFQPTLRNFLNKRWPIIFFYGRWCFLVRCCRKNLQCRSSRFFRSCSTLVVVRPTPACFHLLGNESISPPRKKLDSPILIEKNCSRRRPGKFTDRGLKKSPGDADRTFPNRHQPNIIKGLHRKYNTRHRSLWSRDWYFSADIAQSFLQTLVDNISLR